MKSAAAVFNNENKLHDTLLKVEYCDSNDISGIINTRKTNHSSTLNNRLSTETSTFVNYNYNSNNTINDTVPKNMDNIDHKNDKWVFKFKLFFALR